jgi:hypothetical protein
MANRWCSFPYLVSVNSVLPALVAGNAVLLKPSPQTPLTAERFVLALTRAGVPPDVIQVLHLSPEQTMYAVQHKYVHFVSFTGSVSGGQKVEEAAVKAVGFKGVALEASLYVLRLIFRFDIHSLTVARGERCCIRERRCRSYLHSSCPR